MTKNGIDHNENHKLFFNIKINHQQIQIFSGVILIIYLIYGVYLRLESLDIIRFNEWLTRDFDRAFSLIKGPLTID